MKTKLILLTVAAAFAVSADSQAMMRRAPARVATVRVAKPVVPKMPKRSFGFKKETELYLAKIKKEAEEAKRQQREELVKEYINLNQIKLNAITTCLRGESIEETHADYMEAKSELQSLKNELSFILSEAEIDLCEATKNIKKYNSIDLNKLIKPHQDRFLDDCSHVQMLELNVSNLREDLKLIQESLQAVEMVNGLVESKRTDCFSARTALSDAMKKQMQKAAFKPKC